MTINAQELFEINSEKTLLSMFWGKYNKCEIIKIALIAAINSIIETVRENEQQIEFEVELQEIKENVEVDIRVISYEEKNIEELKKENGEYSKMVLNDIELFIDEFYTNLQAIIELSMSGVITNSETLLTEEINKKKTEIKDVKLLVEEVLAGVGEQMFKGINDKLIRNEKIILESKIKYKV